MLDRKGKLEEELRPQATARAGTKADAAVTPGVIALHDLRTGPEAEVHRLEAKLIGLNEQISHLRDENHKLTMTNQKLNSDLREIRLLLSKVQIDELRGFEKVNSWLRSLKMVI